MKVRICLEVDNLAIDEDGKPCKSGLCLELGETQKEIEYEKLIASVNKEAILKMACLDKIVPPENAVFITPEEYDTQYGDT